MSIQTIEIPEGGVVPVDAKTLKVIAGQVALISDKGASIINEGSSADAGAVNVHALVSSRVSLENPEPVEEPAEPAPEPKKKAAPKKAAKPQSRDQLRRKAKKQGVKGYTKMTKAQLAKAVK